MGWKIPRLQFQMFEPIEAPYFEPIKIPYANGGQ